MNQVVGFGGAGASGRALAPSATYSFGEINEKTLFTIPAGILLSSLRIQVLTSWNGDFSIQIGDGSTDDRFFGSDDYGNLVAPRSFSKLQDAEGPFDVILKRTNTIVPTTGLLRVSAIINKDS